MDDTMDSDTYGAAPVTPPKEDAMPEGEEKPSVDQEEAMEETAMVPTKILSPEGEPLKEGEEIVVQVVSIHGQDAIIKYAPKKKEGGEEGPMEGSTKPGDEESELAALDEKGGY